MPGIESDCVFVIIPELYDPVKGYNLSIIWPNVLGIVESLYFCGHDLELAIEYANELNLARGHDIDFVTKCFEVRSGLSRIHFFNT